MMPGRGRSAALRQSVHRVEIPPPPLSPWLRLAHVQPFGESAEPREPLKVLRDFELILQLEGSAWIRSELDGGSVDVPAGALVFIPPGFVHAWGAANGAAIGVHFDLHAEPALEVPANITMLRRHVERLPLESEPRFELVDRISRTPISLGLVTAPGALTNLRPRMMNLVEIWSRRANRTLDGGLVAANVLGSILHDLAKDAAAGPEQGQPDPRILEVIRMLDEPDGISLAQRPTVGELAALAHLGESAFRTAFVRTTGCGPRRYLEERRVEHAARALVESERPVAEIARDVGYEDAYHFSRVFRRVTGVSPRAYRARGRRWGERSDPAQLAPKSSAARSS
jgi:AraC-like DNA-binding protein